MRSKNLLLAASMLSLMVGASAQAADLRGPYISLGAGGGVTEGESGFGGMGSAAAGYAFGNGVRLELQGEHAEAPSERARGGELGRNGVFANPTNTSSGRNIAARAFIGYGMTSSAQTVDYVRASGGVRGDFFFPNWRYDAYIGKSFNDGTYEAESFLIDRLAN